MDEEDISDVEEGERAEGEEEEEGDREEEVSGDGSRQLDRERERERSCLAVQEAVEEVSLTKDLAGESLSLLAKTGSGLAHAYVRMDLRDK